jgi:ligand-binding SRPBCC domain-containing protein
MWCFVGDVVVTWATVRELRGRSSGALFVNVIVSIPFTRSPGERPDEN